MKMPESVIRVSRIRACNSAGRGGIIFSGRAIDDDGEIIDGKKLYVLKAAYNVIDHGLVEIGQWWRVSGEVTEHERVVDNYKFLELEVEASLAVLIRPSGEHVITLIAESPAFRGVGHVKARKLWERFGVRLYDILDARDAATLESVLSPEIARQTIAAWSQFDNSKTLQWIHTRGFPTELGAKLIEFFGPETAKSVEEDPYRLLSFCARWQEVDSLATEHFGLACDDQRRLKGAIEESLYRVFAAGHTATTIDGLDNYLSPLLGLQFNPRRSRQLVSAAINQGLELASFVVGPTGMIHLIGPLVMEMTIARAVASRVADDDAALMSRQKVDVLITEHESSLSYPLTSEQRSAVQLAAEYRFALLVGGAGVGKTTVLQTLYRIYDASGVAVHQMALAGRAVRRMEEVTGRSGSTIAGFLCKIASIDLSRPAVVVIDEASMLDVITMSRLCESLPSHVRILLTGDSSQLMPVGPGLVLHTLVDFPGIPVANLTAVKRHGGLIAQAAQDVRAGRWPDFAEDTNVSIAFLPCEQSAIIDLVVRLYDLAPSETQVLCAKRSGVDGVKSINEALQFRYTKSGEALTVWNDDFNQQQATGFYLNDLIICSRNCWDLGIQNGSLGRLISVGKMPRTSLESDAPGNVFGQIEWDDGVTRPLFETMLDDLQLGYAITIHKAQGSQWPTVIIPLTASRILDRTLIYTAMTRAQSKVILVGDPIAAKAAVEAMPKSHHRTTGLQIWLQKAISESFSRSQ